MAQGGGIMRSAEMEKNAGGMRENADRMIPTAVIGLGECEFQIMRKKALELG